jgi:biopolymer transport protein ExbD
MKEVRNLLAAFLVLVTVSGSLRAEDIEVTPLPIFPPTASHRSVATTGPRLTILLSKDGQIFIHETKFSADQLTAIATAISKIDPKACVYLRADKTVATDHFKRVVKACSAGGLNEFIMGAYTEKDRETLNEAK